MVVNRKKEIIILEGQYFNEKDLLAELAFYKVPQNIKEELIAGNKKGNKLKLIKHLKGSYVAFSYKVSDDS